VGDYELIERIGSGGMGVVYRAEQKSLGRVVAMKMMLAAHAADEVQVQRFAAEAKAAANLRHPNIVAIHDVGTVENPDGSLTPFFTMDYVGGESLHDVVGSGTLGPDQAARHLLKIARAVQHAHDRGIVHRDLKPSNVLVDEQGEPQVMDFGLAKDVTDNTRLTRTGVALGTPPYMSPEQAEGRSADVGPLSDVYGLGALFYEMLVGHPPFRGDADFDILNRVLHEDPTPPRRLCPGVPRDLDTLCLKCLEKDPHRRYPSAAALADDLERYFRGEPIRARPVSVTYRLGKLVVRHQGRLAVAAACAVAIVLGFVAWRSRQQRVRYEAKYRRVAGENEILGVAVGPFRNISGQHADEWLATAFRTTLETRLSQSSGGRVVRGALVDAAARELDIADLAALDPVQTTRLGERLDVSHIATGEFQKIGDQVYISGRLMNTRTGQVCAGVWESGRMQDVLALQVRLADRLAMELRPGRPAPALGQRGLTSSLEAYEQFVKGSVALENEDLDGAIARFRRAVSIDPSYVDAYVQMGVIYADDDQIEQSLEAFERAAALDPQDRFAKAMCDALRFRSEGFDELIRAAQEADTRPGHRSPAMQGALWVAAEMMAYHGMADRAIATLRKLLDGQPDSRRAWELLGTTYAKAGRLDEATAAYHSALRLRPESAALNLRLALVHQAKGEARKAEHYFAQAERFRVSVPAALRRCGDAWTDWGEHGRAIRDFEEALAIRPTYAAAHSRLAMCYEKTGDAAGAIRHYQELVQLWPSYGEPVLYLVLLHLGRGEEAEAVAAAKEGVDANPDSPFAELVSFIAHRGAHQPAEAQAALGRFERLRKHTPAEYCIMAGALMLVPGLHEQAAKVLEEGLAKFSQNPWLLQAKQQLAPHASRAPAPKERPRTGVK